MTVAVNVPRRPVLMFVGSTRSCSCSAGLDQQVELDERGDEVADRVAHLDGHPPGAGGEVERQADLQLDGARVAGEQGDGLGRQHDPRRVEPEDADLHRADDVVVVGQLRR